MIGTSKLPMALVGAVTGALALAASPAQAQSRDDKPRLEVSPYIEIDQTVLVDFSDGTEAFHYTSVAAGVDTATVRKLRYRLFGEYDG